VPADFSFLHVADLHLDTPFEGIGQVAPPVASALREASLCALDNIVEIALKSQVAFVVIAGDIYDGPERGIRAQLRFRDALARLSEAGVATFIVHGNHDPLDGRWNAVDSWPPLVTVFGSTEVGCRTVERDGQVLATIQGISYSSRDVTENLALSFTAPDGPGLHIGILHCNVGGASSGHADYSPCSLADLHRTGIDYFALGHVHSRRVLSGGDGEPWVVYAGNTQGRSPKPSEEGPKGATLVEVRDHKVAGISFVACDGVRFTSATCRCDELADLGELEDALAEIAEGARAAGEGRPIVLRVRLCGATSLHEVLAVPGAVLQLLSRLRDREDEDPIFCWWDRLEDDTTGLIDLEALRGRQDFEGELLSIAEVLGSDAEERRKLSSELCRSVPVALRPMVDELLRDEPGGPELVRRALRLCYDALSTTTS